MPRKSWADWFAERAMSRRIEAYNRRQPARGLQPGRLHGPGGNHVAALTSQLRKETIERIKAEARFWSEL